MTTTTNGDNVPDLQHIALTDLAPHPDNPRLTMDAEVVAAILADLTESGKMADEHALLVRPVEGGYQIISGHHRAAAAHDAGLSEVPCWVREMSDDEAHMQLALSNAQSGLKPLEIGLHALRHVPAEAGGRGKTGGISDYARRLGKDEKTVRERIGAARVWTETPGLSPEFATKPKVLYEISKAPRENWAELCRSAVDKAWTVERARQAVSAIADDARAAAEAEARIAQQEAADEARWEALLTEPVAQEIDGMEGLSVRGKLAEYENRNRAYAAAEQVKRERERKHREEAEQSARQRVKDAASTFIGIYGSFGSPAARMHMKAAFLAYPHTGVEIGKDFHTAEGVRELAAMLMEYADLLDDSTADVPSIYSA